MPVRWSELHKPRKLEFDPGEALVRVRKLGDLFAPVLTMKQKLPGQGKRPPAPPRAAKREHTRTLPKPESQSGRRLFVLMKTQTGNELWIDMRGNFKRWILRPDREARASLIAMPAGEFAIDRAYYRGEVPSAWRDRVELLDSGAYEVIEGSYQRERFARWFNGKVLAGEWLLEKIERGTQHRSWRLVPQGAGTLR